MLICQFLRAKPLTEYFYKEYLTEDIVTRAFGEVTLVDRSLWSTLLGWVGRMAEMMRYDHILILIVIMLMLMLMMRCDHILILIVIMLMLNGAGLAGGGSAT